MNFEKTILKNQIVFIINQEVIDDTLAKKIIASAGKHKKIGLNMEHVQNIKSNLLIQYMLEKKIKLFNLQDEVLTYLSLIFKDGFLNSYVNYSDFSANKRELVKRHFKIA